MQFKFPINTIAISLTVILLVNVEISAQKWNINIGYANTVPAVDPKVENFHGLDFSLESVVFSRIKAKINFSSFVPSKRERQSLNQFSSSNQNVISTGVFASFDIVKINILDFYVQTGYRYVRHASKGYLRTFIDFPTDGPNPVTRNFDIIKKNYGHTLGLGVTLNFKVPIYFESSAMWAYQGYLDHKIGIKLPF
jgi:hypothetical protein